MEAIIVPKWVLSTDLPPHHRLTLIYLFSERDPETTELRGLGWDELIDRSGFSPEQMTAILDSLHRLGHVRVYHSGDRRQYVRITASRNTSLAVDKSVDNSPPYKPPLNTTTKAKEKKSPISSSLRSSEIGEKEKKVTTRSRKRALVSRLFPSEGRPFAGPEENQRWETRRRAMPKDFTLTPARLAYALKQGLSPEQTKEEFQNFSDHHIMKANKFTDWDRAWQTWCRRSKQYGVNAQSSESDMLKGF